MDARFVRDLHDQQDYVLLPRSVYDRCRDSIDAAMHTPRHASDQESVTPEQAISNPVLLMRMRAGLKQKDLAEQLGVSQAYVSKIEAGDRVSDRVLSKVRAAIQTLAIRDRHN